jgi:type I secretion outer membrane protein, tolC family
MKFYQSVIFCLITFYSIIGSAESLLELYQLAEKNDPTRQKSSLELSRVTEGKNEAVGALLPQINASGQYGAARYNDHNQYINRVNSTSNSRSWSANIQVNQILFNKSQWLKLSLQDKMIEKANIMYLLSQQNLRYQVAYYYIEGLKNIEKLNIIRAEKNTLEKHLNVAKQQFDFGNISLAELTDVQAKFDKILADEILVQNEMHNSLESLAEMTNTVPAKLFKLNDKKLPKTQLSSFEHYYKQVEQSNLELISQQIDVELGKENVDIAKSAHLPTVNLTGSINRSNTQNTANFDRTSDRAFVGVEVQIPIYSGGQIHSRTKQQYFAYEEAKAELEKKLRSVKKELVSTLNNIKALEDSIKAYRQAVSSATTSYTATQDEYNIGTKTIVDLLNSIQIKYRAEGDLMNARYDYLLFSLKLNLLTGKLTDIEIVQLSDVLSVK